VAARDVTECLDFVHRAATHVRNVRLAAVP